MEKQSSDNPVCPKCNSTNVAKYLWGLRLLDDQLERDIEEGRVMELAVILNFADIGNKQSPLL
ncbi:MAG: hypothetical protein KH394_04200 [Atopobium sp.]|nr:hypothetical protein [Atopobium sp.]